MQSIAAQLDAVFRAAIRDAFSVDADPIISVSQNEKFGDYQSNAAMGLAKTLGKKPREVAEQIVAKLRLAPLSDEPATIAGPGFINVRLSPKWLGSQLDAIRNDARLGIDKVAVPQTVVVDYSAPNVAKQMHVGHLRSTIIGDAVSRVLEFQGNDVIRQNHIGDWGTQFGMLIAYLRSQQTTGDTRIEDLDKFYKEARKRFDADPDFAAEARATVVRLQAGGEDELRLWKQIVHESRLHFQPIYEKLNVKLTADDERGESFYNPLLPVVVAELRAKDLAIESEGAIVVFTKGFETPLIVEKTGGGYGYATTDLAAIKYRVGTLGASRVIYVVGSPQSQHFSQVFIVARKAGWANGVTMEHASFGSVLGDDGKMFRARSGDSVKLADLLDEAEQRALAVVTDKNPELPAVQRDAIARAVGIGAVKYADLSKDRSSDYVFSFDQMLDLKGNTAPYLLYAYARMRSIFRKAAASGQLTGGSAVQLTSPFEISIAKHVLRLGDTLALVGRELRPHYLCIYLYDLATKFSSFYENCPVVGSEEPIRSRRLALVDVTAKTLALGLDLLGIDHPDQM